MLKRIIKIKMSGEDVRIIQHKLKEFGFYRDKIDGFFGQNLLISVTNFQRKVGIKIDGVVGPQTWSHLSTYNPNPTEIEKEVKKNDQVVESKIQIGTGEIPLKISYVSENGLVIYDNLLTEEGYYKKMTQKNTIWLHHTTGGSRPDWTIGGWGKDFLKDESGGLILNERGKPKPIRVGKSYVIGRRSSSTSEKIWDGKVVRAFDDKFWAYHLGVSSQNNELLNSKSIGIEICNYGPLRLTPDGRFINCVNKQINESEVCELSKPFRGSKYWEKYTNAQLDATSKLILYLSKKWEIDINKGIYNIDWFEYNESWFSLGGLRTNTQIRRDRYDLFPQKELIEMLNSI
jgi:N-acetyl-anhydromuramyl-L-alanine amidase AmpD